MNNKIILRANQSTALKARMTAALFFLFLLLSLPQTVFAAPVISSFSPAAGIAFNGISGTAVVITGTDLSQVNFVSIAGRKCKITGTATATSVSFTLPSTAISGTLLVKDSLGASSTSANSFMVTSPYVSSMGPPAHGAAGATVILNGYGFLNPDGTNRVNKLVFSASATQTNFTTNSNTKITTTLPAEALTGPVSVFYTGGTASSFGVFTKTAASIQVDAGNVIRDIPSTLYGVNLEWVNDANGLWDHGAGALKSSYLNLGIKLRPGIIRYPGGVFSDYYHWRNGVGPRASRPISPHGPLTNCDQGCSYNDFGTDELVQYSKDIGAGLPLLQLNVATGTATEAASWVSYCNSPVNAERAANGHPTAYNIPYWEIGNEQYLPDGSMPVETYISRFKSWASAMRAVDPTIKIGAVSGKEFDLQTGLHDKNWNASLLQGAASSIDFLALHQAYAPVVIDENNASFDEIYKAMLAFPQGYARFLATMDQQIESLAPASASRIRIAVTEWGPLFHFLNTRWLDHNKTLGSALFTASMIQTFIRSKRVDIANFFKFSDYLQMGLLSFEAIPKADFYALNIFTQHFGTRLISTLTQSPTFNTVRTGAVAAETSVPTLDVVSSLNADGKKLYIIVVNKDFTNSLSTRIQLSAFNPQSIAKGYILAGPGIDSNNGNDLPVIPGITWAMPIQAPTNPQFNLGAPETVTLKNLSLSAVSTDFAMRIPRLSVVALEFTRK